MLIEKIKADMFAAKKAGKKDKGNLLNTLYGEASKVGKDDGNRASTDAEVIVTIKKFLKGIEEFVAAVVSMPEFDNEKLRKLHVEQAILNEYLPKQMSEEELVNILCEFRNRNINEIGYTKPVMGEYMKYLKENFAGLYDGRAASEIVKTL